MIVDIDHIALSSNDVERDVATLKRLSYNNLFTKKGLIDLKIKKHMMTSFLGKLDMAFCESSKNYNIEIINHGNCSEIDGYIVPILENIPNNMLLGIKENKLFKDKNIIQAVLKKNMAQVSVFQKSGSFTFNKVIAKTTDLEKSIEFWQALKFKKDSTKKRSETLTFKSFFGNRYRIFLKEEEFNYTHNLNDRGFNCIAMITTDIEKEWKILSNKGYDTTDIETMKPDKKKFSIFFVKGPGEELVELIGLSK